jgi:hypothetical protein
MDSEVVLRIKNPVAGFSDRISEYDEKLWL